MLITLGGVQFATHNYNLNTGNTYPVVQISHCTFVRHAQRNFLREFARQSGRDYRWFVKHGSHHGDRSLDCDVDIRE